MADDPVATAATEPNIAVAHLTGHAMGCECEPCIGLRADLAAVREAEMEAFRRGR
jgi:hypothetical protein